MAKAHVILFTVSYTLLSSELVLWLYLQTAQMFVFFTACYPLYGVFNKLYGQK